MIKIGKDKQQYLGDVVYAIKIGSIYHIDKIYPEFYDRLIKELERQEIEFDVEETELGYKITVKE